MFKKSLKKALLEIGILPRESALNEVVGYFMKTNQLQGEGSLQEKLQEKSLVYFWDNSAYAKDNRCSKVLISKEELIWLTYRQKSLKRQIHTLEYDHLVHWKCFLAGRRSISEQYPHYFDESLTYLHYIEQPRPQRKFSNLFSLFGSVRYDTDHDIYQRGHAPFQIEAAEKEPGNNINGSSQLHNQENVPKTTEEVEGGQLTNRALLSKRESSQEGSQELQSVTQNYDRSLQSSLSYKSRQESGIDGSQVEWTEHDLLFYSIQRIERKPQLSSMRNLLLESIEACFSLIQEVFFYFASKTDGDQKIMLTSDYDSFALVVLSNEQEEHNAIENARDLLAKLRASDSLAGRLRNESLKEFKLFLEEWALSRAQNVVKRVKALQLLCANILWPRLSVHDPYFTDPHFLLILLGASLQYRQDFTSFILHSIRQDIQFQYNYHIVKVQLQPSGFCTRNNYLCPHNICSLFSFLFFFLNVREEAPLQDDGYEDPLPQDTPRNLKTSLFQSHLSSYLKCVNYQDDIDLEGVRPSSLKHPIRRTTRAISAPSWQEISRKIIQTLYETHRFLHHSFYRNYECSCMNSFLIIFALLEHYIVIALLFLFQLGWNDPTHPVASIAFFPQVDNPERRDSNFQSLFISTVVLSVVYFVLIVFFIHKSKKGLLGYNKQARQLLPNCSCHNFLYLSTALLGTVLFFNFVSIYVYVFSCDVEGDKQLHHRQTRVVCWDGGPHLAWSIVSVLMLLLYYPSAALTWPFLQSLNLTDSLKYNPNYLCFFNHVKVLLIACSAFLKNSLSERILRVSLISVLFAFLLVLAVLMAPCSQRGLNWLLIMMISSCFWISISMIIFVVRKYQFQAELLIGIGVGFLIFVFILILLVKCYFKKKQPINPNLLFQRPQFSSQNHSVHQDVSDQISYPPRLKQDTEQANNKYPPEEAKGSQRLDGGMRHFDKQTFRFQRNFNPQSEQSETEVQQSLNLSHKVPKMLQTGPTNHLPQLNIDPLSTSPHRNSPILLESSFKLHQNVSVPQFYPEREQQNFFENRRRSLENSPLTTDHDRLSYFSKHPQNQKAPHLLTDGNDKLSRAEQILRQSDSPRRSLGQAQNLARESARRVAKTMESAEFRARKERPF